MKIKHVKKLAAVLYLLCATVLFSTCEGVIFTRYLVYTFDNQSDKTIYVTLYRDYLYSGTQLDRDNVLTVNNNVPVEIRVDSSSVNFSWTASNETDNSSIYCAIDQNKAVFRNR